MIHQTLLKKFASWFRPNRKMRIISDPRELANLPQGSIVIAGTRITVIEPERENRAGIDR